MAEQETNPVEMKETETVPMDAQAARKVEQDKLSRRQALRKFGFGAGMAALALLGVDDLARMVGKRMEQMAGDHQIAEQIAHEFREAGVAFADGGGSGTGPSCCQCFRQFDLDLAWCQNCLSNEDQDCCVNAATTQLQKCANTGNRCSGTGSSPNNPNNCPETHPKVPNCSTAGETPGLQNCNSQGTVTA